MVLVRCLPTPSPLAAAALALVLACDGGGVAEEATDASPIDDSGESSDGAPAEGVPPDAGRGGPPASWDLEAGHVDPGYWSGRRQAWLEHATTELSEGSITQALAHMERDLTDPDWSFAAPLPADAWDGTLAKIGDLEDTSDFAVLYLLNAIYGYRGHPLVPEALWEAAEATVQGFKFWYTQPTPEGLTDDMWYWSENHQAIFHTCEILAGQRWPELVFPTTGMTGAEHYEHGVAMMERWMDVRERFGFFEWHSNVYYKHSMMPLLSLAELAEDEALAERAAILVDTLLFDLGLHVHRGTFGATHGRTYKKDKMRGTDASTWNATKLLWDRSDDTFMGRGDALSTLLARAQRYRVPQVIIEVGRSEGTWVDRERMGIPLDEHEPIGDEPPVAPYGLSYDDEEDLPIWWSMSALSAWQVVPLTLSVVEAYDLWETELFQGFAQLSDFIGDDIELLQELALETAHASALALLRELVTYTWRSPEAMLSSALDYRKGSRSNQQHIWQATLSSRALVFTTHPGEPPRETLDWREDGQPGSWTGTASIPRVAQVEDVAIQVFAPQYEALPAPFDSFTGYELYTHAYFPQDAFDEVIEQAPWIFGRLGEGYLGLYSWRATSWLEYDPSVIATDGHSEPFDLVAEGGPDNVWIAQLGSASGFGDFASFVAAVGAAEVAVEPLAEGLSPGVEGPVFDVRYASPTQGLLELGWEGPLLKEGEPVELHGGARFDNPWCQADFEATELNLFDAPAGVGVHHDHGKHARTVYGISQ